jgi:hypothetical protein
MRRDQLEHAIRAACQIAGLTEVIIVGSQAILGTYTEDELPFYATRSAEIDVLPIADDTGQIARLADDIEGIAGEFSPFAELHGFSIDGVDLQTSALPYDGAIDWSKSRTPTRPLHRENLGSSDGASTRRICVSRNCVPSEKKTRTSLMHSLPLASLTHT